MDNKKIFEDNIKEIMDLTGITRREAIEGILYYSGQNAVLNALIDNPESSLVDVLVEFIKNDNPKYHAENDNLEISFVSPIGVTILGHCSECNIDASEVRNTSDDLQYAIQDKSENLHKKIQDKDLKSKVTQISFELNEDCDLVTTVELNTKLTSNEIETLEHFLTKEFKEGIGKELRNECYYEFEEEYTKAYAILYDEEIFNLKRI